MKIFNVTDYGAVGDGKTLNTASIQRAIDECAAHGGGPSLKDLTDIENELLPGWICERVNTSDWEGPSKVGGVFFGSAWCETSILLTFSEIIWNEEIFSELLFDSFLHSTNVCLPTPPA